MKRKLLLIGWDAADWNAINPLMDAGKMPNLQRLVEGGVMGNMATLYPPLSPMLWTSIATGKRPYKHGIYGFSEPTPDGKAIRPITNLSRKCRALWNMMQLEDKKSIVVGWWPSHPVEPIDGVMISDMFQKHPGRLGKEQDEDKPAEMLAGQAALDAMHEQWPVRPNSVHPPSLTPKIRDLRIHPQELESQDIALFVPDFAKIDQDKDHRLEGLAKIICECTTVHAAATGVMQNEQWDFMGVYYDAIDHFGHGFMKYHPPRLPWVPEEDFELYKNVIESGYIYHDMMLGALMQLAGEDTTIMLVSDHGFHPDHNRPQKVANEPAGPAEEHSHYGIVVLNGPGIKKDERIYGANLLDVAPTVLHAMGMPVGEDMDGKVLINAFDDDRPIETIASWEQVEGEDGMHPAEMAMDSLESKEALDQLVALGYIEKPDEDIEKAVRYTVRELEYNLARSYMDAGLYLNAAEILTPLFEEFPDEYRFGTQLIACHHSTGQLEKIAPVIDELHATKLANAEKARQELETFTKEHSDEDGKLEELEENDQHELRRLRAESGINLASFDVMRGNLANAQEDFQSAKTHYAQALAHGRLAVLSSLGNACLRLGELDEAEKFFETALQRDANDAAAYLGHARLCVQKEIWIEAIDYAERSIGLLYHQPQAHYVLANALRNNHQFPRAIEELNIAVRQHPNFVDAWELLAKIYANAMEDAETSAEYSRKAAESRDFLARVRAGEIQSGELEVDTRAERAMTSDVDVLQMSDEEMAQQKAPLSETVTIVSGLPRSGTSMMMQMLEAGGLPILTDRERVADEDNPKGYYEYTPATRLKRDKDWVEQEATGHVVKIVAQLLWELPRKATANYRIVFMNRNVDEVMESQRKMLERSGKRQLQHEGASLGDTFRKQLVQTWRFLGSCRIPVLMVDYHEAIDDPEAVAGQLNRFFDGELDEQAMAAVVDSSLYRNRGGVVSGATDWPEKN